MFATELQSIELLPPRFALSVLYRDDWWTITSPEFPGLYIAHRDLNVCLSDVTLAVGTLRRLNAQAV